MSSGEVKIKITVDGKPVHEATKSLKDFQSAASGIGEASDGVSKKTDGLGTSVKTLAASLGLVKIASAAFDILKSSVSAAVKRFDALQSVPKVLEALGAESDDAERSIKRLADGIEGLPTSLDEISSTMKSMFLVFRDADKATDSALALNNALLASGTSGGAAQMAMEQYMQALQKGKPDMMEWRSMQTNMVVALDEVAKQSGITVEELGQNLRSGKIPMSEFNDMLIEIAGSTGNLGDLAKTMTAGIGTSFNNLKLAITKGLANILDSINTAVKKATGMGIAEHIDNLKATINAAFKVVGDVIAGIVPIVLGLFNVVGFVIDVLKALSPVVYGAVAAFVAFHAVTLALKLKDTIWFGALLAQEAILKLTTSMTAATASTGLLTKAVTLLKAAWASNPYAMIAVGVGVAVAAILTFIKVLKSSNSAAAEAEAAVKRLTEANKKHAESVHEIIDAYNEETAGYASRKRSTSEQIMLIDELASKEEKSADEKMRLSDMVAQLNSVMEDLNLVYDAEADALNMSTEAIKERMSSLTDVEEYNSALDTQANLQQKIADNDLMLMDSAEQIAKYEKIAADQLRDKGKVYAHVMTTLGDLQKQEKETLKTREELLAQQDEVNKKVSRLAPIVEKVIAKQEKQKKVVGGLASESEALAKATKEVTDAITKNTKAYEEKTRKVDAVAVSSNKLSKELDGLLSKEALTTAEMTRAKAITEQLNASNEGLTLTYNAQTNSLNMASEERQRRISLIAEEASYSDAMERLLQIEEDKYTAEARLEELAGFRQTYNDMMASGITISEEQAEAFAKLFAEEETLKGQTYLLGLQYDETMGVLEESATRIDSLKLAYEKLTEEQQKALDGMINSMLDYHAQSQNIFDKLDTGTKTSWKKIQKTLQHNAKVMSEYWTNIGILMEEGVDEGIIQQLIDAGVKAAPEAAALAKKASLGKEHVKEINDTYAEAGKIPEDVLVAMMKKANIPVTDETKALVQEIANQMQRETGTIDWNSVGEKIPEGLIKGAYDSKPAKEFVKDVGSLASEASDEFQRVAMIHSPSQVFYEHGRDLALGLVNAVKDTVGMVVSSVSDLLAGMIQVFRNIKSEGLEIGKNFVSSIATGLKNNARLVNNSVKDIARSLPTVTRKVLEMRSPSRIGVSIGANWVDSIGIGMSSRKKELQSNVKTTVSGIQQSTNDELKKLEEDYYYDSEKAQRAYKQSIATIKKNASSESRALSRDEKWELADMERTHNASMIAMQETYQKDRLSLIEKAGTDAVVAGEEYVKQQQWLGSMSLSAEIYYWNQMYESLEKGSKGYEQALSNHQSAVAKLRSQMESTNDSYAKEIEKISETHNKEMERIEQKRINDSKAVSDKLASDSENLRQKLERDVKSLNDTYDNAYKQRLSSLTNFTGLFDKYQRKTAVPETALIRNLESQVSALEDYSTALEGIKGRVDNEAIIAELESLGPNSLAELEALNRMTDDQLAEFVGLYEKKFALATTEATSELAPLKAETEEQIRQLNATAKRELAVLESTARASLEQISRTAANELLLLRQDTETQLAQLEIEWVEKLGDIVTGADKEFDSMKKVGSDAIAKLEEGLLSGEDELMATANRIASNIRAVIASAIPSSIDGTSVTFSNADIASGAAALAFSGATGAISAKTTKSVSTGTQATGGITQNITILSPDPLSPSEIARQTKNASRQLAMEW